MARSRILVVDDDPASRDLLRRVLAGVGHEVAVAASGREALEALARHPADLVVSDIRMPDLDGVQLLEKLRERAPEVPVILVTAFGDVEGAVEAIRRGAFDYLAKPYDVDGILYMAERQGAFTDTLGMRFRGKQRGGPGSRPPARWRLPPARDNTAAPASLATPFQATTHRPPHTASSANPSP